ncbi:MAG: acetyl-CoA carboxylase biotin carboxylase subunit, partial [Fidelibacterota bacterium]
PTRSEAIKRMLGALDECIIEGIKTNIPFQKQLLNNAEFQAGEIHTGFLDTFEYIPEKG